MKRKTNLFYTTGPDSKFITFSNYTESLTGNFLSTDTKIFPSRFIALYIKGLNKNTKSSLIKYISKYYESKLAVLRDYFDYNKSDIEKSVSPLNYLLEALLRIQEIKSNEVIATHSIANNSYVNFIENENETSNQISYSDIVKFKYISDITEQDYNGTFTDTICNIDLRKFAYVSSVELTNDFNDNVAQFDSQTYLYGWDSSIPSEYANEKTLVDSIQGINLDVYYKTTYYGGEQDPEGSYTTPGETSYEGSVVNEIDKFGTADSIGGGQEKANYAEYSLNTDLNNVFELNELSSTYSIDINSNNDIVNTISDALHSTDEEHEEFRQIINSKLNNDNDKVIFYDANNTDIIYVYEGANVEALDMTKNNEYNIDPEIVKLNISTSSDTELEFNCIIPLYDIVNINYRSNFNTIERMISSSGTGEIDLNPSDSNKLYCVNVPLGMWMYTDGKENDEHTTSIKLYKDTESGFSQSWTLTIASQFKPFPYSNKMPSELTTNSNTNAYATFAQVLASQSAMIDNFNKMTRTIAYMNDHIRNMESQLANLGTSYNIDNIHREFNNFEIEMNNKFNDLKDDVISKLSYLRWHTTI